MRRIQTGGLVALVALSLAGAASADNPTDLLPAGWSHAAINVTGEKGKAHTLVYDRGTVTSVGAGAVTLTEQDGSVVTISVAVNAVIKINGAPGTLARIQLGSTATTTAVDGAPAKLVQVKAAQRLVTTSGRVVAVGHGWILLRTSDGSNVRIAVAGDAKVSVNFQPSRLGRVHHGDTATTVAVNGRPAVQVDAQRPVPPPPPPTTTSR